MTTQTEALKLALEALEYYDKPLKEYSAKTARDKDFKAIASIKEALVQSEQEPVAYIHRNEYNEYRLEPHDNFDIKSIPFNIDVPLFKSPQRTWVGLTDEETKEIQNSMVYGNHPFTKVIAAIENKLKEKNT